MAFTRKSRGDAQPASSSDLLPLQSRLDEIAGRLDDLARISRERERVIDRLHLENQELRAGELQQAMTPMVRGLMRLYDGLDSGALRADSADARAGVRNMIADLLYNCGVDRFEPAAGATFNPREHRGVAPVTVADPALDRTVARCLRSGFRRDARILREADVEVYRFIRPIENQASNINRNGEDNG